MLERDKLSRQEIRAGGGALLSVITPAYNESDNLSLLYKRLSSVLKSVNVDWEWIVIDDHSSDETFAAISEIASRDSRVRAIRFARNFGAHTAITCGLHHAKGDCVVVMAGDLQDPPETLPALLTEWYEGAQVVWAARDRREGEKASTIGLARLYYFIIRRAVGIKDIPGTGTDFFLIDRSVVDAFCQFKEGNIDIVLLITWMGFRQTIITYDKQARLYGRSGWSLQKKLKLAVDSVTSFTYVPIRIMSYVGFLVALAGFVYAGVVIANYFGGEPALGWSSLMVVVLVVGGIQMLMMGVLGEYLWRALDESRRRPRYLIEASTEAMTDVHPDTIQRQSHG